MLNTIAYYCGFNNASVETPQNDQSPVEFLTQEEDHWTIVDINKFAANKENEQGKTAQTPTPSMECSWLVTPPPCFNAASSEPLTVLSDRENFLIEHPSMFVVSSKADMDDCAGAADAKKSTENDDKPLVVSKKPHQAAALRRSQRKAARQALQQIAHQQQIKRKQTRKNSNDVTRRNKSFQKMRQIVHQPRKHY